MLDFGYIEVNFHHHEWGWGGIKGICWKKGGEAGQRANNMLVQPRAENLKATPTVRVLDQSLFPLPLSPAIHNLIHHQEGSVHVLQQPAFSTFFLKEDTALEPACGMAGRSLVLALVRWTRLSKDLIPHPPAPVPSQAQERGCQGEEGSTWARDS